MNNIRSLIPLLLLSLFSVQCVETLITIRVFPDGRYGMDILSRGDSTDVFDQDFQHPAGQGWTSQRDSIRENDDIIYSLQTTAILEGKTIFYPGNNPAPVKYPVSLEKKKDLFSSSYHFKQVFSGRNAYTKYPEFANSLDAVTDDSTRWISEAFLYITHRAMDDLQNNSYTRLENNLFDRIQNHLRGVFSRVEEMGLFENLAERNTFIHQALNPFLSSLPEPYLDSLFSAMNIYEDELEITAGLKDDQFVYHLIMPGVITATNADSISGDTLKWLFTVEDFINDDYILTAESLVYDTKQIQQWIIAGAFIALLFLILLAKRWKNISNSPS